MSRSFKNTVVILDALYYTSHFLWHDGMETDMTPFVIDGLAGWLHVPQATLRRSTAILFCPALTYDMLDSYHSLRVLADRLSEAGYPVMRFAYPGTGDSCDIAEYPGIGEASGIWAAWQQSVLEAADRLSELTASKRLVFCGLRMGATIAALAAQGREDVAGLMLFEPVPRGRSYLLQMQVEFALKYKEMVARKGGLNFHELDFDAETVRLVSQVDLRHLRCRDEQKIALFVQNQSAPLAQAAASWTAQGAAVEIHPFAGLKPMLCHETQGDKLPPDPTAVIAWLSRHFPEAGHFSAASLPSLPVLNLPAGTETPLRFGPNGALFGIHCRPCKAGRELAVVILNTGRHPRHGVGRFGVEFARELAQAGIASLRIDFSGLGDSWYLQGEADLRSDVFEDERCGDVIAAVDALEMLGYTSFAVQGLWLGCIPRFSWRHCRCEDRPYYGGEFAAICLAARRYDFRGQAENLHIEPLPDQAGR